MIIGVIRIFVGDVLVKIQSSRSADTFHLIELNIVLQVFEDMWVEIGQENLV